MQICLALPKQDVGITWRTHHCNFLDEPTHSSTGALLELPPDRSAKVLVVMHPRTNIPSRLLSSETPVLSSCTHIDSCTCFLLSDLTYYNFSRCRSILNVINSCIMIKQIGSAKAFFLALLVVLLVCLFLVQSRSTLPRTAETPAKAHPQDGDTNGLLEPSKTLPTGSRQPDTRSLYVSGTVLNIRIVLISVAVLAFLVWGLTLLRRIFILQRRAANRNGTLIHTGSARTRSLRSQEHDFEAASLLC